MELVYYNGKCVIAKEKYPAIQCYAPGLTENGNGQAGLDCATFQNCIDVK